MAAKKAGSAATSDKNATETPKNGNGAPASAAPTDDGWEDAGSPDIDGWFSPEKGRILTGQIVDLIKIVDQNKKNGETRDVLLIKISKPCTVTDSDKNEIELEPGKIAAIGVRAKLTNLLQYVTHKGQVWIQAREKVNIKGGKTMWLFECKAKGTKAAPPAVQARVSGDAAAAGAPGEF